MSFTSRMKHVVHGTMLARRADHGIGGVHLGGLLVDKGERYGAALGFGALKGYYRERFAFGDRYQYGGDLIAGGALTLLGVILNIASGGRSHLAPHLERIGDAGLSSHFHGVGVAWGTRKAGRSVMVLDGAKKQLPNVPAIVGGIPPAVPGSYLTPDQMAAYSQPRT